MRVLTILNGEIINIAYPSLTASDPLESINPDAYGYSIIYVGDGLDGLPEDVYMATRFWNGSSIQVRDPRPSEFFFWENGDSFIGWTLDTARYLSEIRRLRNIKLMECDWTQIEDAPISAEKKLEYQTYRQALRDMTIPIQENPQLYTKIEDAPWPTPPA